MIDKSILLTFIGIVLFYTYLMVDFFTSSPSMTDIIIIITLHFGIGAGVFGTIVIDFSGKKGKAKGAQ
ncbi:MAG: hypothetical protein R3321_05700 [Nitrososphaeraceae archaeon]|nr:hypothetical protein [Nitrososphaeraceae archaeon]